jgi:3'-5' exoribonuclease
MSRQDREVSQLIKAFEEHINEMPYLDSREACLKGLHYLKNKYPAFFRLPASTKPEQHHYFVGGLAEHTLEVFEIAKNMRTLLSFDAELPITSVFLAALYHDAGKAQCYQMESPSGALHTVHHNSLSRMFHHVTLGMNMFLEMAADTGILAKVDHLDISHTILAHHGCREWGSPVAPATVLAQLIHQSDTMSARMDDAARRVDPLKFKPDYP